MPAAWLDRGALRRRGPDVPRIRAILGIGPGTRLLDVGGGAGAVTALLAEGAARAWVLEPGRRNARRGRRARPGLGFVRGSAERIPLRDACCDAAVALMSLHHVRDARAALGEVHRVLAPGGRVVLLEADPAGARGRRLARVERWLGTGAAFRDAGAWCALLREAGFVEARSEDGRGGLVAHARR